MSYFERREILQTFFNVLAMLGTFIYTILMFSYVNVSNYLEDKYTNNSITIELDQFRTKAIGSLLLSWCFIIMGAESQSDLDPGQYKRVMVWVVNTPAIVYFIINPILSHVAVQNDIYKEFPIQTIVLSSIYGGGALILNSRYIMSSFYKNENLIKLK